MYKREGDARTTTEGKYINLSLHYLEQVILSLHTAAKTRNRSMHIPYRNSVMTSILRDSLGGNCRTVFVATINSETDFLLESISTCRFAQRCSRLTNEVFVNEEVDLNRLTARLKIENESLLKENAELRERVSDLEDRLRRWEAVDDDYYENREAGPSVRFAEASLTPFQRAECADMVTAFLHSTSDDTLPIQSAAQAQECFAVLRRIVKEGRRVMMIKQRSSAEFVDAVDPEMAEQEAKKEAEVDQKPRNETDALEEAEKQLVRRIKVLEAELEAERASSANIVVKDATYPEHSDDDDDDGDVDNASGDEPEYVNIGINPIKKAISTVAFDSVLTRGGVFLKHGRRGKPHPRYVWVTDDFKYIKWRKMGSSRTLGSIRVADLLSVTAGTASASAGRIDATRDHACITISAKSRTLNLEVDVQGSSDARPGTRALERNAATHWLKAFRHLVDVHALGGGQNPTPSSLERSQTLSQRLGMGGGRRKGIVRKMQAVARLIGLKKR